MEPFSPSLSPQGGGLAENAFQPASALRKRTLILKRFPCFAKTEIPGIGHDHVIENTDPEKKARRSKSFGHGSILGTGTRVPARMVVDEHERGCRMANGVAEHLPWMDQARGQGSDRDFFGRNQAMTSVEEKYMEGLSVKIA